MTARNESFASFPLPHQYADAGSTVRTKYDALKNAVQDAIRHPGAVKENLCKLLPVLFDLRMSAIAEESFSFKDIVERNALMYSKMMRLKDGTGLEHLLGAIRFSMRTYDRVMQSLAQRHPGTIDIKRADGNVPFVPNYDAFLATLGYLPQGEIFLEWVHSSLFIEFGLIALDNLDQDFKPMPPNALLEELATLVNDAAQSFGSTARQIGVWPKRSSGNPIDWSTQIAPEDFTAEQDLAEAGFSDFAQALK